MWLYSILMQEHFYPWWPEIEYSCLAAGTLEEFLLEACEFVGRVFHFTKS